MTSPHHPPSSTARPQRGVTLIEALVALLVMSFGMVALVGLQGNLRRSGDLAKQRSEAMRIAQAELATLRSFSALDKPANPPANVKYYDDIKTPNAYSTITWDNANTTFTISRMVTPLVKDSAEPQAKTVRVTVSWNDRTDAAQSLTLDTIISRTDPVYGLALGVTPPANGVRQPDKRNPVIPPAARDLGNGSSAFRPSTSDVRVWVFNNVTGIITSKCQADLAVTTLTASDLDSCDNSTIGYLLSGTVRFSNLALPDPSNPEANALPDLMVSPTLTASQIKTADGKSLAAGGNDYPSPGSECFSDKPSSSTPLQKLVNYYCIVYPNSQHSWWGKVLVNEPASGAWSIGTTDGKYKVCRYSGDYNGNGYTEDAFDYKASVDRIDNEEHPAVYRHVGYSLVRQNFLVIAAKATCPLLPADVNAGRFVDYSTYQIQP